MCYFKEKLMNITSFREKFETIDTPAYIFDINKLEDQINNINRLLENKYNICYAMKANPYILDNIKSKVDRLEVCSPGEYELCKMNNIDPDIIIVSGVNKTIESIERILDYSKGKGIYTIESYKHYEVLSHCAKKRKLILNVIIRLSSGNQFGVDNDTLESIIKDIDTNPYLKFIGIHYYSGTQKKINKIKNELDMLDEYALYLKDNYNMDYIELEYGPGNMISYFQNDKISSIEEQLIQLKECLVQVKNYDKITLEYGRFIAANCGYYITKINDIKTSQDTGYIIIDGGIHQINYYGQLMGMKKPYMIRIDNNGKIDSLEYNEENIDKWQMCGSLCTVNDVLVRDISMENPCIGDIIIFENVGAYSVTEGMSLFLSRELPKVYIYNEKESLICVGEKLETYILNSNKRKEILGIWID